MVAKPARIKENAKTPLLEQEGGRSQKTVFSWSVMYCPVCRSEYRSGFTECADCQVQLVDTLAAAPAHAADPHDLDLVTAYATSDAALFNIAAAILGDADVPFLTMTSKPPWEFKVNRTDAERAGALLAGLESAEDVEVPSEAAPAESLMVETRAETPANYDAIGDLLRAAFKQDVEPKLVELLRDSGHAVIALVAVTMNEVVGHIVFSPVSVARAPQSFRALGLGPVAVLPEFQANGIGSKLIRDGLAICRDNGYDAVVVLGDPDYYTRFGFAKASRRHLKNEYGVDAEFMVLELRSGGLEGVRGLVQYGPEFADTGA
jgi:putative acetyltransferase